MDLVVSGGTRRHVLTACRALVLFGAGLSLSCGVQEHPQSLPPRPGSGGQTVLGSGGSFLPGTGGQNGSGGSSPSSSGGAPGLSSGGAAGPVPGTGGGGPVPGSGGAVGSGGNTGTGTGGGAPAGSGGAAPASGAGVMINGTFVPKEKAIVFIHFGHSNMRGQAINPASLHSYFYDTQPNLWTYQADNTFQLAHEPTAPEGTITAAGPGTALLKTASAMVSPNSGYQFISIGRGIGSDTTVDYLPTGAVYPSFVTARAKQLVGKVTFGAAFIMLGITERHLPTAQQPGYPGRVQTIVAALRADLGEPNLPILYCDYEQNATGTLAPTGSVGVVILPLTRMLPTLIKNLVLVPTDNIPRADYEDDHHFNMTGHQIWATSAIGLMVSNNWFPWK